MKALVQSIHNRNWAGRGASEPNEAQLRMIAKAKGFDEDAYVAEHLGSIDNIPGPYHYLWNIYRKLSSRREYNDGLPTAISFAELKAFADVYWIRMAPWEIEIITDLDDFERGLLIESIQKRRAAEERKAKAAQR